MGAQNYSRRECRTLKAHDDGDLEVERLCGGDDALRDDVAAHDAAEDVHEDRAHVRVRADDAKRLGHLLRRRAAAHIQEVCRLPSLRSQCFRYEPRSLLLPATGWLETQ